jgi:peroxiredoxin
VKLENFEKHGRNQHPREEVDFSTAITKEERRKVVQAEARSRRTVTPGGFRIVLVVATIIAIIVAVAIINPFRVGPGVGQIAPDFTLDTTDGSRITLYDLRDQPVLLEFMDVDCPACIAEADVLPTVYAAYSGRVHFLSVDVNFVKEPDNAFRINEFRTNHNTLWPYMLDVEGKTTRAFGVDSTPTTFILDAEGKVVQKIVGSAPGGAATYAAALDDALQV